ncbi:MAG TPA: Nramp family divalent metal transporter [Candidatus Acidoferrales bacterium]|nr:Nramp family divalent metal transporter [Candidatus Acidoferrales bacterium]
MSFVPSSPASLDPISGTGGANAVAAATPACLPSDAGSPSLPESYRSIPILASASFFRKMIAFAGPGYLVAVGYMDPGNWATDLGGGSRYGYTLLSAVLISSLMAIFLQALSAKLGIATGRDLAQACREHYSRRTTAVLWVLCEIAIAACDLAEVLGSAVALKLLFGLPLLAGVLLTGLDVLLVLALQGRGFRVLETLVITLILTIGACFAYEIFFARPLWIEAAQGFVPTFQILKDRQMLYLAIGILGATVMPHNLYLHSSIVQTRAFSLTAEGKREAVRFATLDSTIALGLSLFINAAILVLGAAAFHVRGMNDVADISQAYQLLTPVLGVSLASVLFAAALLCSGQNSTLTGTLAGQICMEGFLHWKVSPWLRRLITRSMAIIPAALVIGLMGENHTTSLLILSQVILSFQLPFAVVPLIQFTGDRSKMGEFTNSPITSIFGWFLAAAIILLNAALLWLTFGGKL